MKFQADNSSIDHFVASGEQVILTNGFARRLYHILLEVSRFHFLQPAPAFQPASSWATGITTLSGNQKVLVCGLPKSGNVWCRRLLVDSLNLPSVQADSEFSKYGITGWHRPWHFLLTTRRDLFRCFYVIRDIRDVIVSYYHYSKTDAYRETVDLSVPSFSSIDDFYTNYFLKKLVPYYSWKKHPDQYVSHGAILVKYEDLKSDTVNVLSNMLACAGFMARPENIIRAVEVNSFDQLKKEGTKLSYINMSQSHFRKGIVGDYMNEMSESLIDRITDDFGDFLSKWGYA